jgi:hypothetical protein
MYVFYECKAYLIETFFKKNTCVSHVHFTSFLNERSLWDGGSILYLVRTVYVDMYSLRIEILVAVDFFFQL